MYENYLEGSIISLKLKNFQTYEEVEFAFNPRLNFIAGPNGSGKSSIANAIAFLFGGTPKTLGKVRDLSEYVKFDEGCGYIEARIKIPSDPFFCTVKRTFTSTANRSEWYYNGSLTTRSAIQTVISNFNINVDSLCQFLPQEKVSEFVRLMPEELLNEVIEVSKDSSLARKKKELSDYEKTGRILENDIKAIDKKKSGIEKVIKNLKKDVDRIKEREDMKERVRIMKLKLDWLIYEESAKKYVTIKKKIEGLRANIQSKYDEIGRLDGEIQKLKKDELAIEFQNKISQIHGFNKNLDAKVERMTRINHLNNTYSVDLSSLDKKRETRQKKAVGLKEALKQNIKALDQISLPEPPDLAKFYDPKVVDKLEQELSDLKREKTNMQRISDEIKQKFDNLERKKRNLSEVGHRRMEMLRKYHKDTYLGVLWLRSNKNLFRDEIIEPAYLHIGIKDMRYAAEIETFFGFQILSSFICKNSEDFSKLMKILKDEQKLGINAVDNVTGAIEQPSITREELEAFGFDGYITDFIEARDEVINYLSIVGKMHLIPITKKDVDESRVFSKSSIKRMAARNKYIEVKRSRYDTRDFVVLESNLIRLGIFDSGASKKEILGVEALLKEVDLERKEQNVSFKRLLNDINGCESELNKLYTKKSEYTVKMLEITQLKEKSQPFQLNRTDEAGDK
jgi:chromosome segregation ATPase